MKRCSKCGETKPREDFYVATRNKDGRQNYCKPCTKEWAQSNPDKVREKSKRWQERNRERYLAQKKTRRDATTAERAEAWAAYYEKHRDRLNDRRKLYAKGRTPEQIRRARERRRARLLDAFVADVDYDTILARDLGVCGICKQPIFGPPEIDHILPLAAGGTHEPDNVQLAHLSCNRRKGKQANFSLQDAA